MKLSNANPVSTWMGDILTQQCSVEWSCIFYLFILFIYLFLYLFFSSLLCHSYQYVFERNLVFSMKLSNANPVSAWVGERLTLSGAVDFSCIFFLLLFLCLLIVSLFHS